MTPLKAAFEFVTESAQYYGRLLGRRANMERIDFKGLALLLRRELLWGLEWTLDSLRRDFI